jgi:hypothetical protein
MSKISASWPRNMKPSVANFTNPETMMHSLNTFNPFTDKAFFVCLKIVHDGHIYGQNRQHN